jgi:hypothetical protein
MRVSRYCFFIYVHVHRSHHVTTLACIIPHICTHKHTSRFGLSDPRQGCREVLFGRLRRRSLSRAHVWPNLSVMVYLTNAMHWRCVGGNVGKRTEEPCAHYKRSAQSKSNLSTHTHTQCARFVRTQSRRYGTSTVGRASMFLFLSIFIYLRRIHVYFSLARSLTRKGKERDPPAPPMRTRGLSVLTSYLL